MMETGIFTISLDYELHWGVFDVLDRDDRMECYRNTLGLIKPLLELFMQHDVHVTWAVVGSMFASNAEAWKSLCPTVLPNYSKEKLSAYKWAAKYGLAAQYNDAHFSPGTIRLITKYRGQEVASHTFSHMYCLQHNNGEAFAADLVATRNAAALLGIKPVSIVFPRNQVNPAYMNACFEVGYRAVRVNPGEWMYAIGKTKGQRALKQVMRTANEYFSIGQNCIYPLSSLKPQKGMPVQIPRGWLLKPWEPGSGVKNALRLRRIRSAMLAAARQKKCFHLWWHPEDFGEHPEENMRNLKTVLQWFLHLQKQYGMQSLNMGEIANLFYPSVQPTKTNIIINDTRHLYHIA